MLGVEYMRRFKLFKETSKEYLTIGCDDEDTEKTILFLQDMVDKGLLSCVTYYKGGKKRIIL